MPAGLHQARSSLIDSRLASARYEGAFRAALDATPTWLAGDPQLGEESRAGMKLNCHVYLADRGQASVQSCWRSCGVYFCSPHSGRSKTGAG